MKLHSPIRITPRLMAGVNIAGAWISIERDGETKDNRDRFRYAIDLPNYEYEDNDTASGVGGGTLQHQLVSLLNFLSAAGESYRYNGGYGDEDSNAQLFPEEVSLWASENEDALCEMQSELEENENLIEE